MRRLWLIGCCVLLMSSLSLAKDKLTSQWICAAKPLEAHSIDVGDQANHAYVVSKESCNPAKSDVGGAKEKEGGATQFNETMGDSASWHGVFISTTDSGDKIYYHYTGKGMVKGGQFQSGTDKWTMVGGTGKFASAKGDGTCEGKGNADGSVTWDCTGMFTK